MREIVFWGATGQAKVLREALRGSAQLVALVDNRKLEENPFGVPILQGESGLDGWLSARHAGGALYYAVAVGGARGADRLMLMGALESRGLRAHTIIHPAAFVATDAEVGEGCQILAQSAVCASARLGRGVIVNTAASADHDCNIGDGAHLAPGARLAGEVTVGKRAFVGTGAIVLPHLTIGDDAVIGAGAVVTRDVAAGVTVVGNPARILRVNEQM